MSIRPEIFYPTDLSRSKDFLEQNGYVVLGPILSQEEIKESDKLFWEMMCHLNPKIDPKNRQTWQNTTFPGEFSTGICGYYGMAQSDYAWYFRTNPLFRQIFGFYHQVDPSQLCVSMDCLNVMFSKNNKKKSWLHRDINPSLPYGDLLSIQGFYSRYDVEKDDSGFVCVPKSHLLSIPNKSTRKHWNPLELDDPLIREGVKLLIPSNSLIVWNSKTVHANSVGKRDRPDLNGLPQLNRQGVYLSYWPRKNRSLDILEKKKELYKGGQGTSHWGILAQKKLLNPRWPRNKNSNPITFLPPTLNEDGNIPNDRLSLL